MHVVTKEEIALIAIVFVVAFASTLSRAVRDGDRRGRFRLFGLGATSGFFGMGLYCIGSGYVSRAFGSGANLIWIGVAAFVGFMAKYQDKIGSELFVRIVNRTLGGTIAALSSIATITKQPENDDDNQPSEPKK